MEIIIEKFNKESIEVTEFLSSKICFQVKFGLAKNKNFVVYGATNRLVTSETWTTSKSNEQKATVFEKKVQRNIFAPPPKKSFNWFVGTTNNE